MRVHLIVTGDLEQIALAAALEAYFRGLGADVAFSARKVYGLTSNRLPAPAPGRVPAVVQRLANSLVTDALERSDSRSPLPDLVIGVDDLELANLDQPQVVIDWVRLGVQAELDRRYAAVRHRERAAEQLRGRCAFHLLVPLVEAYFFGDPDALAAAGVPATVSPQLGGADLEQFEALDAAFLRDVAARQTGVRPAWWREACHPKRYLEYLVRPKIYDETVDGVRALRRLAWPRLAERQGLLFLRALMQELAGELDVACPLAAGARSVATCPDRRVKAEALVLRNV